MTFSIINSAPALTALSNSFLKQLHTLGLLSMFIFVTHWKVLLECRMTLLQTHTLETLALVNAFHLYVLSKLELEFLHMQPVLLTHTPQEEEP